MKILPLLTLIICALVGTAQAANRKPNVRELGPHLLGKHLLKAHCERWWHSSTTTTWP
jgi:hypothetical protein